MMKTYGKKLEVRLVLWQAQIDELTLRIEKSGPMASLDLRQRIDELKAKCALARASLDRALAVTSDSELSRSGRIGGAGGSGE